MKIFVLSPFAFGVVAFVSPRYCFGFHYSVVLINNCNKRSSDHPHRVLQLKMGGYYSEPSNQPPAAPHMVFGIRCVEESILLPNHSTIKAFYPVDDTETEDDSSCRTPYAMIDYLLEHAATLISGKRVLEIGATGLSLVVAAACENSYCGEPAASIMAYSDDAKRLQLFAAQTILNPLIHFPTKLETFVWNDSDDGLDALLHYEADVICITQQALTEEGMRQILEQQHKEVTLVHYDEQQQLVVARTTSQ